MGKIGKQDACLLQMEEAYKQALVCLPRGDEKGTDATFLVVQPHI
jgi:hypothetical protein